MIIQRMSFRKVARWVCTLGLAGVGWGCHVASADPAWPGRPLKLIVPYAAGGGTDVTARGIANKLGARLGQPIVIENKGGAGGTIGSDFVAKAPPDGYTLLFTTTAIATIAASSSKLPFDARKDFDPIGQIGSTSLLLIVSNDSEAKSVQDLVRLARANPTVINYGSGGMGSMSHLGMELFASAAKVKLLHVPYKGMAPAFNDVMTGNVQAGMATLASSKTFIDAGKVRALAVTGEKRSPFLPNLPTMAEAGLPGAQIDFWWGLLAPRGTPAAVIQKLNQDLNWVLAQEDIREILARDAAMTTPGTPEAFRKVIDFELTRWSKLVKEANIKIE